jgi:hypothetical protein
MGQWRLSPFSVLEKAQGSAVAVNPDLKRLFFVSEKKSR